MQYFDITVDKNELGREIWWFALKDTEIVLRAYISQVRETPRHKWRAIAYYRWGDKNSYGEIPKRIPSRVEQEAKRHIIDLLVVKMD